MILLEYLLEAPAYHMAGIVPFPKLHKRHSKMSTECPISHPKLLNLGFYKSNNFSGFSLAQLLGYVNSTIRVSYNRSIDIGRIEVNTYFERLSSIYYMSAFLSCPLSESSTKPKYIENYDLYAKSSTGGI